MTSDLFEPLFWVAVVAAGVLSILAAARREFAGAALAIAVLAVAVAVAAA